MITLLKWSFIALTLAFAIMPASGNHPGATESSRAGMAAMVPTYSHPFFSELEISQQTAITRFAGNVVNEARQDTTDIANHAIYQQNPVLHVGLHAAATDASNAPAAWPATGHQQGDQALAMHTPDWTPYFRPAAVTSDAPVNKRSSSHFSLISLNRSDMEGENGGLAFSVLFLVSFMLCLFRKAAPAA